MGEITEGMLEGIFCQECGCYIDEGCGYPVSCDDCKPESKPKRKPKKKVKK